MANVVFGLYNLFFAVLGPAEYAFHTMTETECSLRKVF
jgi:hypothetical protein